MSDDPARQSLDMWNLIGIGGFIASCLLGGMGLGWLVDHWLHTMPACTLAGLALGLIAGVVGTWFRIRRFLV
ncbi:MAG: AtpZ/AtpI family protein [Nocardioidaceae bacterium]